MSAGYLVGRTPPFSDRERYQHDVAVAAADLRAATAASGNSSVGASLAALTQALPVYTGYVEDGEICNSLGFPDQSRLNALLADASAHSAAAGAGPVAAARSEADAWFAVNERVQALDKASSYGAETQLVIGSGPGTAATLFGKLSGDLDAAIASNQAVFASNADAGRGAFAGLEAGVIVLALGMAAGCAWGLSRRLAEYR